MKSVIKDHVKDLEHPRDNLKFMEHMLE
jgi:hypothetical protein